MKKPKTYWYVQNRFGWDCVYNNRVLYRVKKHADKTRKILELTQEYGAPYTLVKVKEI